MLYLITLTVTSLCRSHRPRSLRRRSAAVRLLRLWVRITPGAWMFVCCDCCVLSGRGLCDELITRPEESYRLCCVVVCDLETSWMRRPWPTGGCRAKNKQTRYVIMTLTTLISVEFERVNLHLHSAICLHGSYWYNFTFSFSVTAAWIWYVSSVNHYLNFVFFSKNISTVFVPYPYCVFFWRINCD